MTQYFTNINEIVLMIIISAASSPRSAAAPCTFSSRTFASATFAPCSSAVRVLPSQSLAATASPLPAHSAASTSVSFYQTNSFQSLRWVRGNCSDAPRDARGAGSTAISKLPWLRGMVVLIARQALLVAALTTRHPTGRTNRPRSRTTPGWKRRRRAMAAMRILRREALLPATSAAARPGVGVGAGVGAGARVQVTAEAAPRAALAAAAAAAAA